MHMKYALLTVITIFTSLIPLHGERKTEYQRYIDLSAEKRRAMARQYVKKQDGMWAVTKGIYRVYTDIGPEKTFGYALFMQDFAGRISTLFKGRPGGTFRPAVYITGTRKNMLKLIDMHMIKAGYKGETAEWTHGLYIRNLQNLYAFESKGTCATLLHEGTHQFLHYLLGSNIGLLPVWLNEGLATNFETWDQTDSMADNLKKSRKRSGRRYILKKMFSKKKLPMNLEQLFSRDSRSWSGAQGDAVQHQYTLAWSFTDYLLNSQTGLAAVNRILQRASRGRKSKKLSAHILTIHAQHWRTYVKEKVLSSDAKPGNKRKTAKKTG